MKQILAGSFIFCLLSAALGGQQPQTTANAAAETLPISPGDRVQVSVFGVPELSEKARVTDAGDLPLVLGGSVHVAGLTPILAARAIGDVLVRNNYMLHPQVLVAVDELQLGGASVVGQVKKAGSYPITAPRSLLDVLALAGGLNDTADRNITVIRHGTGERLSFFYGNDASTLGNNHLMVNPGDTVVVSRAAMFFVLGDVTRAGGYVNTTNHSQVTVLQAVSLAGGSTPTAAVDHAVLVRRTPGGEPMELHLHISKIRKAQEPDIPLRPDDILYIPFSYLRNIAVGAGGLISAAASAGIYRF